MSVIKSFDNIKESETIEFKKSTAELKAAVVSIVAMLNKHNRAEVYFGIDDNAKVLGLTIGKMTIKDVTQAVVDNTEPKVFPKVEVKQIDRKHCIVIEITQIQKAMKSLFLRIELMFTIPALSLMS